MSPGRFLLKNTEQCTHTVVICVIYVHLKKAADRETSRVAG